VVEPNQTGAAQAVTSPVPEVWPPAAPDGYEEFFRESFKELVRTAMYAGATRQEAEDAAAKALAEMLERWGTCERSLAYARTATVHNFIKDKTRGPSRVARRMVERGHVPRHEGVGHRQLTEWEDEAWVTDVLSSLPSAQREVMELIMKELSRAEIAEALGKTKEAIRRNLCDARARLSRELKPDGEPRQDSSREHPQQPPPESHALPGRRPDDHQ
jgi:RNA polymerase sigma factor (sigma-70 family)